MRVNAEQPNPVRRDSIIMQAAREICRYIESGALAPGERLPPEVSLSQMLGISRNSLRETLRVLDGLGFIEKRPDRGIVVKSPLGTVSNGPGEHGVHRAMVAAAAPVAFQARAIVEGRCAELAVQVATEDDIKQIESHLKGFHKALVAGDYVTSSQEHLAFHDAIVNAAHNAVLTSIYYQVRFVTSEIGQVGAPKLYKSTKHYKVHAEILKALRQRDKKKLLETMASHFTAVHRYVEFMASNQSVQNISAERSSARQRQKIRRRSTDGPSQKTNGYSLINPK